MYELRLVHHQRFVEYFRSLNTLDEGSQLQAAAGDVLEHLSFEMAASQNEERSPDAPIVVSAKQREWMGKAWLAILQPGLGAATPASATGWRAEAVVRWGPGVPDEHKVHDWETYVRSRLPTSMPPSPLDIMQERYAYDIWRLLVACTLMTRINSERIKEGVIGKFFAHFPIPSSFLARSVGQEQQLQETIRPLGLVESRVKTITELTQSFLEMQVFDCGLKKGVNKIAGCGPFVVDSFHIFCRGVLLPETSDDSCRRYLEWRRSMEPEEEKRRSCEVSDHFELAAITKKPKIADARQVNLLTFFKCGS